MFTADDARNGDQAELDRRIKSAVEDNDAGPTAAYLRVYNDDPWRYTIKEELERRGFKHVDVPDIIICGDVYFEWSE